MSAKKWGAVFAAAVALSVFAPGYAQDRPEAPTAEQREIARLKAEVAKLKAEIARLKRELAEIRRIKNAGECKVGRGVVAAACSLYFAHRAALGEELKFPDSYNDPKLYANGKVPKCPSGGVWTYSKTTGRITKCSVHGP